MVGKNRRILLIGGEGVVLYAMSSKGIERETAIAWEVPNFDHQLTDALTQENTGKPVIVLFDGADQAYRKEENIPKLSPFDRPRYVRRKLELAFPNYPIRASLEVKAQKIKGRKSDGAASSYLFAALPDTEQLDRVGGALFEAGVPVAGFGLLPVESAALVTALMQSVFAGKKSPGSSSRWSVLIGQHETGGLRQVVVKDGNLALARLTPTSEAGASGTGWVEEVQRGFKETLAYGLDVIVICGDVEKQFFDPKALPVTNFRCLNAAEALKLIGVKPFGLEKNNFADALHAAWVGKKGSLRLPVRVPSIHRIMAPRLGARISSIALVFTAIALGALTVSGYDDYLGIKEELVGKQNQQQMMQREYEEESKQFDGLPVKPDVIKTVLSVKGTLEKNTANPLPFLARLKTALGGDITLKTLSYTHTAGAGLKLDDAPGAAAAPPPPGQADRGRLKIGFTFGLPGFMPLEQKVTRSEALEKSLQQAFPGWDVNIVSQFGKVSRSGTFQGGTGAGQPAAGADANDTAEFSLEGAP